MTESRKKMSQHEGPSQLKAGKKLDIFSQFENSRNVLQDNSHQKYNSNTGSNKMLFRTKSKQNLDHMEHENYDDDFEDAAQVVKKDKKRTEADRSFQKKKQTDALNRGKNDKKQKKREVKSVMEGLVRQETHQRRQSGRYQSEISKRFDYLNLNQTSNDQIVKNNELVREYIKKYNDILTEMINRNLAELTSKKKKAVPVQDILKVMQEQIKNNYKIEQLDQVELKKMEEYQSKLQQQESYNENNFDEQKTELQSKIKDKKKDIYNTKMQVQNQAKKLIPAHSAVLSRHQGMSEIVIVKQKLAGLKKQHDKNEERIKNLQTRQAELMSKIQEQGDIDKEADMLRTSVKQTSDKQKRYQDTKKKFDALKAHKSKTESLWATKCSVIQHENEAIRLKVKNVQLQIKNMEQSVKLTYQKSMKTLATTKPKYEQNQKSLDKIMAQINLYQSEVSINKQLSLSQMKLITKKKNSTDQMPTNLPNIRQNQVLKIETENGDNVKTKSQEGQRNRVWKQRESQKQIQTSKLTKSYTEKQVLKIQSETTKLQKPKQHSSKKLQNEEIKDKDNADQANHQNKPKKFNFSRNKANSQVGVDENKQKHEQLNIKLPQRQIKRQSLTQDLKEVQKQEQKHNQGPQQNGIKKKEEIIILQNQPKVFNLRQRKSKQQSNSYMPSNVMKNDVKEQPAKSNTNQNSQQHESINKPAFNLKRKRDNAPKQKLTLDNQFMNQ